MSVDRRRVLRMIALVSALGAYATIVLGAIVRGTGAGLACPDWPLCHGSLVPDLGTPVIAIEYAHRLAAAITGLCLLLTFLLSFMWFRSERRLVTLSFATLAILAVQIGIGALTIASSLDWVVVTVHLALATATFAMALVVALVSIWRFPSSGAVGPPSE